MKTIKFLILLISTLFTQSSIAQNMNDQLKSNIKELASSFDLIPDQRKSELKDFSQSIKNDLANDNQSRLIFVCTHNSRRSQLSEIWMRTAAHYYGITGIQSYSGGTESTAFNSRMVYAVKRYGFELEVLDKGDNTVYQQIIAGKYFGPKMFSKKYDDTHNPDSDFIAVMVCSDADQKCPFVPGAQSRIALPYLDPKAYDNTPDEQKAYDDKVIEIGREILYVVSLLKTNK